MDKVKEFLGGKVMYDVSTVLFALAMLIGGTANTILFKAQDLQYVKGLGDGPPKAFEHPFTQAIFMFAGMFVCLFVYYPIQWASMLYTKLTHKGKKDQPLVQRTADGKLPSDYTGDQEAEASENFGNIQSSEKQPKKTEPAKKPPAPIWSFALPATFDLLATALMNIGLIFVQSSVFSMLRGSVIIFSCIASVIMLKDQRYIHHWISVGGIFTGALIVGTSAVLKGGSDSSARNPLLGIVFISLSQILQALQMVFEEIFLSRFESHPLQVAGWQGFWGIWITCLFLMVEYWIPGKDYGSFESFPYAAAQLIRSPVTFLYCMGSVVGCFVLNYTGVTLTSRLNNTARGTIDSCRTFAIWMFSLIIGWEKFDWMQVGGFGVILTFTFLYNGIIKIPYYNSWFEATKKRDREFKAKGGHIPSFLDYVWEYLNYGVMDQEIPEKEDKMVDEEEH